MGINRLALIIIMFPTPYRMFCGMLGTLQKASFRCHAPVDLEQCFSYPLFDTSRILFITVRANNIHPDLH